MYSVVIHRLTVTSQKQIHVFEFHYGYLNCPPINNQINCKDVNTIWPLFTNSYIRSTANLPVIYKIYVYLTFTVKYCFYQKCDSLIS